MTRAVAFDAEDIVAIIDSAPGGGVLTDPTALCNRPAVDPANWLSNVKFHSRYNYYELAAPVQTVSFTHTALAGAATQVWSSVGLTITINGQVRYSDLQLYHHGLGYVPAYMIAWGGARLPAGTTVQIQGAGTSSQRSRTVSHWADEQYIYLYEEATSADVQLDAVTLSYQVLVFTRPAADPVLPLMSYDNAAGAALIDHGRVRSDRHYLRKALPAESALDINLGPTMDINDGFVRTVSGGVVTTEPGYGGSFAGPPFVAVSGVF